MAILGALKQILRFHVCYFVIVTWEVSFSSPLDDSPRTTPIPLQ